MTSRKALSAISTKAVIWDMGGVLVRTEDPAPRQALAERLGMKRAELETLVFAGESGSRAQRGEISYEEHWENLRQYFGFSPQQMQDFSSEFWKGDRIDADLVNYIRSLRSSYKTGLLSNAFSDLRGIITEGWHIDDAFDVLNSIVNVPTDRGVLNLSNGAPCPTGVNAYLCAPDLLGTSSVYLPGYFSAPIHPCEIDNTCTTAAQKQWWKDPNPWADASPPKIEKDANGNQIASVSYLIHRMCAYPNVATNPAPPQKNLCQTYADGGATGLCNGCSKKVGSLNFPAKSIFYRITTRSVGPRNTVAYTQAMVLLPE